MLFGIGVALSLGLAVQGCTAQPPPRTRAGRSIPEPAEFYAMYELDFPVSFRTTSYLSCDAERVPFKPSNAIALHEFHPLTPAQIGTVVIVHGYLSHAGHLSYLIRKLSEHGYTVLAMDLPGHGLSGGRPGDIADFSEYARCLQAVQSYGVEKSLPTPYYGIGFSTGGAAFLNLLQEGYGRDYARVALAAPLVRFPGYRVLPLFTATFQHVVRHIPTNDSDPLAAPAVPLNWVAAANRYAARIEKAAPNSTEVLVLQGDNDDIIAWRHNLSVLEDFLPNLELHIFPNGRHELYRNRRSRREAFIRTLVFFQYGAM
jgi:alpha-beta hydrolase superfamily lysophospholipase